MKLVQSSRKATGAVLTLVVFTLIILLALGMAFFYGQRIVCGYLQLQNATDAGIIAVARQALVQINVPLSTMATQTTSSLVNGAQLSYSDFAAELKQPNGTVAVDLLNYNRLVAHAVLVCSNASYLNAVSSNEAATRHAALVCEAVQNLALALKTEFLKTDSSGQGPLDQTFLNMANINPLSTLPFNHPNTSLKTALQPAYIHHNGSGGINNSDIMGSANVWLDPGILGDYGDTQSQAVAVDKANWYSFPVDSSQGASVPDVSSDPNFPGNAPKVFGLGYSPVTCLKNNYNITLSFVPVFPTHTPHLIAADRFDRDSAPVDSAPPNAFRAIYEASGPMPGSNSVKETVSKSNNGLSGKNLNTDSSLLNSTINKDSGTSIIVSKQLKTKSDKTLSKSVLSKSSSTDLYLSSSAAAIVGCMNVIFPAAIPGGFIRIKNMPNMLASLGQSNSLSPISFDCSKYIIDNDLYSSQIDIAKPIPMLADGVSVDLAHVIWIDSHQVSAVEAMLQSWAAFNSAPITSATSPYWNKDLVNGIQGNITIDPLYTASGTTAGAMMQSNPHYPLSQNSTNGAGLHMGTSDLNTRADLQHILQIKGFIPLTDLIMGDENITGISNKTVEQILVGNAMTQGLAQVLNWKATPKADTTFSFSNAGTFPGFDAVLYAKMLVASSFPYPSQWAQGTATTTFPPNISGVLYTDYFDSKGTPITYTAPNNLMGGSSFPGNQFRIASPINYLNMIDTIISKNGGYAANQTTQYQFLEGLLKQARQINPAATITDLTNALQSTNLGLGQTLYLHANPDPNAQPGHLFVMDKNVSDSGLVPDGLNMAATLCTLSKQHVSLLNTIVNAKINGTSTAMSGDCNTRNQPWQSASAPLYGSFQATFLPATGYQLLLGELDFSEGLVGNSITFMHPN